MILIKPLLTPVIYDITEKVFTQQGKTTGTMGLQIS